MIYDMSDALPTHTNQPQKILRYARTTYTSLFRRLGGADSRTTRHKSVSNMVVLVLTCLDRHDMTPPSRIDAARVFSCCGFPGRCKTYWCVVTAVVTMTRKLFKLMCLGSIIGDPLFGSYAYASPD